jgi:hypothetical protein
MLDFYTASISKIWQAAVIIEKNSTFLPKNYAIHALNPILAA